jgi:hypothetical protein
VGKFDPGKLLVVSILLIAALAAGGGMWFRYAWGRQALALWGPEVADLIQNATEVEAWKLAETGDTKDAVVAPGGKTLYIVRRKSLAHLRDLVHYRRLLLADAYFDWEPAEETCEPQWTYVLQFKHQEKEAAVFIDGSCHQVAAEKSDGAGRMKPPVLKQLTDFLGRELEAE